MLRPDPAGVPLPPLPDGDLWVFGYGSLMWRPGFEALERRPARLAGLHRALCVWSWVWRGVPERPGLVFGLDRGGACVGRAYRIAAAEAPQIAAYLHAREVVTPVYVPVLRRVRLDDGRSVGALTFTVDRRHPQYAGRLTPEQAAAVAAGAAGRGGPNIDYLRETAAHLAELGVRDPFVQRVAALLERFASGRHRPAPPPGHPTPVSHGWPGRGAGRPGSV